MVAMVLVVLATYTLTSTAWFFAVTYADDGVEFAAFSCCMLSFAALAGHAILIVLGIMALGKYLL